MKGRDEKAIAIWVSSIGVLLGILMWAVLPVEAATLKEIVNPDLITTGGSGCPGGAALSVMQSEFSGRLVIQGVDLKVATQNKPLDRKACSFALPIQLPPDRRLVLGEPAVFGTVSLESGAVATVRMEAFVAGGVGASVETHLSSGEESPAFFYERDSGVVRTACGEALNLRLNLSAMGQRIGGAQAQIQVEGVAITAQLEDCP